LPKIVDSRVLERFVKLPLSDPSCGYFQPSDAARDHAGAEVAEQ
jgi:hypothetical protein